MQAEKHFMTRSGWLRAAVLGANDGILSTASLAIAIASASQTRDPIVLAALAGLVAGALSMAAGEYVSVSSQSDVENADLKREEMELRTMPESELQELALIYESRGLTKELSKQVAIQLTNQNALEAHARDELGINEMTQAKPLQAALASAAAFFVGGFLPLVTAIFAPLEDMIVFQYGFAILFLAASGALAAKAGGSNISKAIIRIILWGTLAMIMSAVVGHLFSVNIN
jgi:VIT1/CCC1 family predicted Fe2+/Mn2+ transporter